jgi:hypothetical protein
MPDLPMGEEWEQGFVNGQSMRRIFGPHKLAHTVRDCGLIVPLADGDCATAFDRDKIDDAVLALLYLTLYDEYRAWKGFDWDALDRLYDNGMIENPRNKNKSVAFTAEGRRRSKHLFEKMFGKPA